MFKDIKKRVKGYTPAKPLLPVFRRDKETASPKKMEKQPAPKEEDTTQENMVEPSSPTSPPPTSGGGSSRSSLQQPPTPTTPIAFARFQSSSSLLSVGSDQLLDHSHLKPGANAELLSYAKTINMYRSNAKKTNNPEIQCDFAIFLVEASKRLGEDNEAARQSYLGEAEKLLKQVALRGHGESQYYLANMYAAGVLNQDKPEFDKAFPLYVQAAKHHNPDAAFRAAKCYEDSLGTRRDKAKAAQYYKKAASLNHPGAMYRLGLAEINGELGMSRNLRNGHKWLKRSGEAATPQFPHALHELALLHEKGFEPVIFVDHAYAIHLYTEAAALGYAPSAFRLGECYEFGKLGCDVQPNLSIQYYSIAADQDHPEACFALTSWYLVGSDLLETSEEQAFAWAYRAAMAGLPKAEYALGYFYEVGIGIAQDIHQAVPWYLKAAEHGEKRATKRLRQLPARVKVGIQGELQKHMDHAATNAAIAVLPPFNGGGEPQPRPGLLKKLGGRLSYAGRKQEPEPVTSFI